VTLTPRAAGLAILTAVIYAAAFLGLVTEAPIRAESDKRFPEGSSMRRADGGAALAAEYLSARGRRVESLLNQDLSTLPAQSVVFVLRPGPMSDADLMRPLLTPVEEAYLRRGGRVVLTLNDSVPSITLRLRPPSKEWTRVHPLLPESGLVQPVTTREISGSWMEHAHALFLAGSSVVAARRSYDLGDLIVFGTPDAFTNERLAAGETLGWLETLTTGRAIFFDETVHGMFETKGIMDLLAEWGLRPALGAACLLALAWVARERAPFGPPESPRPKDYADSVDLIGALGLLYSRSVSDDEALARYSQPVHAKAQPPAPRASSPSAPNRTKAALAQRLREINQTLRSSPERARPR
jgi:hypothetical protein